MTKPAKIRSNQWAELYAIPMPDNDYVLSTDTRLRLTDHGELFCNLLLAATKSGKYDNPAQMVEFCAYAAREAVGVLALSDLFALEAPPRSAIARKIAKANKEENDV